MKPEDKQLLLKDLCTRLPYEVILLAPNGKVIYQTDGNTGAELLVEEGWKPYLRPMSSMTEEESKQFLDYIGLDSGISSIEDGYIRIIELGIIDLDLPYKAVDWLNANHFDYRGLIPKGLAIEAPEGMYK